MIKIEYHHFAIPNETLDLGNDHKCLLKPLNEKLMEDSFVRWTRWTTMELNDGVSFTSQKKDHQTLCLNGM